MVVDAEPLQHARGDEACHSRPDDDDVANAHSLDFARRHPGFGRQLQPSEILRQSRFQCIEPRRRYDSVVHRDISSRLPARWLWRVMVG
ncbi:hypothetical protein BIWAKO_06777 [Bosea sp. BIWAKO-01]|nr:hypothetical protein BIWAKO_06777 [Bosea sp. BIWAKO-01]